MIQYTKEALNYSDFQEKGYFMENIEFKHSIDISPAGKGCSLRTGDIDGDGRLEFVLAKPGAVTDERYFDPQVAAISVFSAGGELLWQTGESDGVDVPKNCDLPIQVYDIDKDGKNEIIAVIGGNLSVFDGKTGEIKKQIPLPDKNIGGALLIADLEGSGYAQNIILKNKFSRLWALDANLNVLWDFEGNIGLAPVSYDLDGDGCEEIIAGYNVLSPGGEILWELDLPDHAYSAAVECLYKENEPIIIIYGPTIRAYTHLGELLWEIPESSHNLVIGKFRDNVGTLDILNLDNLSLFDNRGNFLYEKNETIYLPVPVVNFDATEKVYIAGHKKEDVCTTLYDGYMRGAYTLPAFGNIASCDILGDGSSQVIIYSDDTLDIYSPKEIDLSAAQRPYFRPQPRHYSCVSIYNTLPLSRFSEGYVIEDFASQNIVKWAEAYAETNMYNRFAKVTRSEFVLLLATLLNLKESFSENFSDVSKESVYYDAVGTFRALGIVSCEDNLFLPDTPITVSDANYILDKLSIPINFNFDEKYELSKQDMARLILNITE